MISVVEEHKSAKKLRSNRKLMKMMTVDYSNMGEDIVLTGGKLPKSSFKSPKGKQPLQASLMNNADLEEES